MNLYFPSTLDGIIVLAKILAEIYLIKDLRAKMLVKIDILITNRFLLDYIAQNTIIDKC